MTRRIVQKSFGGPEVLELMESEPLTAVDLIVGPERFTDEQAGAFPMAATTAWQALADTTHVSAGTASSSLAPAAVSGTWPSRSPAPSART